MAVTTAYIAAADLLSFIDIDELAQVSADPSVDPSGLEADLQTELEGGSSGNADAVTASGKIEKSIGVACSTIDGYLCGRYELPMASDEITESLKRAAVDLTRLDLHDHNATDEIMRRAERADRFLRDIANGTVKLTTAAGVTSGGANRGKPQISAPGRSFTADDACDFMGQL